MIKKVEYFEDNKTIKGEGLYDQGNKEGKWLYYYYTGTKYREINYTKGIENGKWTMWHENGQKYIEQQKINGVSFGDWIEYYENGKTKEAGEYIEGKYYPKEFWDENGIQLMKNGSGKKIEIFGFSEVDILEQYYENGIMLYEKRLKT